MIQLEEALHLIKFVLNAMHVPVSSLLEILKLKETKSLSFRAFAGSASLPRDLRPGPPSRKRIAVVPTSVSPPQRYLTLIPLRYGAPILPSQALSDLSVATCRSSVHLSPRSIPAPNGDQ
jgi:hypothetical protein